MISRTPRSRQAGFELGGSEMRVMGVDELIRELREEARELYERYRMDRATDELRRRFEEILDREQRALERAHGHESQRLNQFLERRHHDDAGLADAIERFRDHAFEDGEAEDAYRELLEELERLRELERFQQQQGERFRGSEQADYETAQDIREQHSSALQQMMQALAERRTSRIHLARAAAAKCSAIRRRPVASSCPARSRGRIYRRTPGYLRDGKEELTPQAQFKQDRRVGAGRRLQRALRKGSARVSTTRRSYGVGCSRAPTRPGRGSSATR